MKKILIGIPTLLVLGFVVMSFFGLSLSMLFGTHVHDNSPANTLGSESRLFNTLQVNDSYHCVEKTGFGWYTSKSRMFNNGNVVDTVRADTHGERNCHFTFINGGAHQVGSDPGSLDGPTHWEEKSDHGT